MAGVVPIRPDPLAASRHDRHFATDHLMGDLKGRSVRGGAVTLSAQAIKFVLQMGSTMALARLLTPADFGLVAMVAAFTGFIALFKDLGLSMATVQRKTITHDQVSALFWVNVAVSIVLVLLVAASAPLVSWFYGRPELTGVTLALAATFIFSGLTAQHQALLRRQMRLREIAIIEVLSLGLGVATAITLAVLGFKYWALVAMTIVTATANCVGVWLFSGWRPTRPAKASGVRSLLSFGGGLTTTKIANYFFRNLDNILVGYFAGAVALGFYSTAYRLLLLPIQQINEPITGVMLPVLSRLQDQPERYRRAYVKAVRAVACLTMPMVGFFFLTAEPLIGLVLGDQWLGAVPIFLALAPAAYIATINIAAGWTFVSMGHIKRQFKAVLLHSAVACTGMICGIPWGGVGIAAGLSTALVLIRIPYMMIAYHGTPVRMRDLWSAIGPPTVAMLAGVGVGLLVRSILPEVLHIASVVILLSVFGIVYSLVLLAHGPVRRELPMMIQLLRQKPEAVEILA